MQVAVGPFDGELDVLQVFGRVEISRTRTETSTQEEVPPAHHAGRRREEPPERSKIAGSKSRLFFELTTRGSARRLTGLDATPRQFENRDRDRRPIVPDEYDRAPIGDRHDHGELRRVEAKAREPCAAGRAQDVLVRPDVRILIDEPGGRSLPPGHARFNGGGALTLRGLARPMGDPTASSSAPRFARYRPTEREVRGRHFWAVPEGGMCLSAFLVLTDPADSTRVLLGRPSPAAPWSALGSLDPGHLASLGERWILPSSHLMEWESPFRAAERVAVEQLGRPTLALRGPEVFSETYPSAIDPESGPHWDLHFVFRGEWTDGPAPPVWRDLSLRRVAGVPRSEFGRGHADILALAGMPVHD